MRPAHTPEPLMSSPRPVPVDVPAVVRAMRTVAVVGCSPRGFQTSHRVASALQRAGVRIVPVHPDHDEILGERAYPDLLSIPEDVALDIVCVFRRPEFTPAVVQDAADRRARTGQNPVVWTQIGVHSEEGAALAVAEGLPYVADRCLMVDHQILVPQPV